MTTVKLTARLTDSGGAPLSGKTIYFYVSGDGSTWSPLTNVATDSNGYATTTYDASGKTWFKAEFRGDDQYDPASATAVWEPLVQPPPPSPSPQPSPGSSCPPLFSTGNSALDSVVFCVGNVGVTTFTLAVAFGFLFLLLLLRR